MVATKTPAHGRGVQLSVHSFRCHALIIEPPLGWFGGWVRFGGWVAWCVRPPHPHKSPYPLWLDIEAPRVAGQ